MFNEIVKLFSKNIYITLKLDETNERRSQITVSVELHTITSPFPRKELKLRLTDESDLFFYFSLIITEEDFQCLKSQQALLVDFSLFPQKFINLLELCTQEEAKENPKFVLVFSRAHQHSTSTCGRLDVVETNLFKHLTHLSLNFVQGSDHEVKNYLALCLQDIKDRYGKLEKQLAATENDLVQRLQRTQECLDRKTSEFDRLSVETNEKIALNNSRLMHEMRLERETSQQRFNELQARVDGERKDLDLKQNKACAQFQSKISYLERKASELEQNKCELESVERDLRGRLAKSQDEMKRVGEEAEKLHRRNAILEKSAEDREDLMKSLRTRNGGLEQEVKSLQQANAKQQSLYELLQDQKQKLDVCCQEKQVECNKLSVTLKELTIDVDKANEIIRKLQHDVKVNQAKAKVGSQIALEQEKLIKEKDSFVEKLHADLSSTAEKLGATQTELHDATTKLESANEKIEKLQKDLKTNEKVIDWLNKQLNERNALQQKGAQLAKQHQMLRPMHNSAEPLRAQGALYAQTAPKAPDFGYFTPIVKVNRGREVNKENDAPLDGKYFEAQGSVKNDGGRASNNTEKHQASGRGQMRKSMPLKSNRIAKSDLLLGPTSSYFPKSTTNTNTNTNTTGTGTGTGTV